MPRTPIAALGTTLAAITFGAALLPSIARADSSGDTMRAIAGKYKNAAVTLTVVVRTSGTGEESSDAEVNVPGFVVDPSGLVVTIDSAIDPASMMAGLMPDSGSKMTTKVVSAKILTTDGTTIPAQVVLRDSDRNIAFIRPIAAPASPATFVDLASASSAQIGDPVFCIAQLGKTANHSFAVTEYRIISVMEHPRTLYVPESSAMSAAGDAVFNEQGVPLGILSMRFSPVRGNSRSLFSNDSYLPIVVPAADVAEEIKQALAAKAPAPLPPAKAPTPTKPAPKAK